MTVSSFEQCDIQTYTYTRATLNNASDYQTNGLYRTPNPSPIAR